ncbi:hypothetical protein [Lignipirellula cremea]|uniref:Chromosome partition protein Smc n=1 Tax=Lignipirellula cremea TaxID=2528010 RepID=A0A518E391_9BACT|nr:hypothetical protein [Lignipirellula cremea]QDU98560.1 hypothetical protein Pla8534_64300 [Lignipirellula cremea]
MTISRTHLAALLTLLLGISSSHAQAQTRPEDIASGYSESVANIYEQIDEIGSQLEDSSLSMSQAAAVIEQQSALRRQADTLWENTETQIKSAYGEARDSIVEYNTTARQMEFDSAIAGTIQDVLTNVGANPTKASFESNKAAMAQAWEQEYGSRLKTFDEEFTQRRDDFFKSYKEETGIDLKETGYARIGSSNPYNDDVYYKYYGPDGEGNEDSLLAIDYLKDAEGYQQMQEDFATRRRRQKQQQELLAGSKSSLEQFNSNFRRQREQAQGQIASLANRVQKVSFTGNWSGRDSVGNWLKLRLNSDGTTVYFFGGVDRPYSGAGRWEQRGTTITMRTNDGQWSHVSTITTQNRLQFTETREDDGRKFTNYLTRN